MAHAMLTPSLALAGWLALSLLLNLAFARRSQLDHWAEANPKLAGMLKLSRSLGLDPWLLLQAFSLFVRGHLPPGAGGSGPPTPRDPSVKIIPVAKKPMPPGSMLIGFALLLLTSCASNQIKPADFAHCSPPNADLAAEVSAVLTRDAGDAPSKEALDVLKALANRHGVAVVACLIGTLVTELDPSAKARAAGLVQSIAGATP